MPDQRCLKVLYQRLNNVDPTLKMKLSTLHNVDTSSVFDVETTLKQRWYNFISTLFQLDLNISKSYIKTSPTSDKYEFVNR